MAIKEKDYKPSGSLFTNEQRRGENSPDYNGYLPLLDIFFQPLKSISRWNILSLSTLDMDLSRWKKIAKSGKPWLRITANVPKEKESNKPF